MVRTTLLGIIIVLFTAGLARGSADDSLFAAAGKAYDGKDYATALSDYLKLEKGNRVSAALYFNIANCYFRQGKLGHSVLYYMRAQRLAPRDEDIKSNLAFARQFMPVSLEGVKINPVTSFLDSLIAPFTLNGVAWTASLLFIFFLLFLAAVVHFRWSGFGIRLAGITLLLLVLVISGLTTYKYRTEHMVPKGVVVTNEAQVYSGPGEDNDLEFVGAYGLTFEVEKSLGDYYRVIFENQRKGWIKKAQVEII